MKNYKKGFTLIELLVVIAIISLLTSVALASLSSARKKAADSTIKQNLVTIRTQAEIIYTNNGTTLGYDGLFDPGSVALSIFNAAVSAAQCPGACGATNAEPAGTDESGLAPSSWRAWVPLRTDSDFAWCVDYTGASEQIDAPTPGGPGAIDPPYTCSQL